MENTVIKHGGILMGEKTVKKNAKRVDKTLFEN